MTLRNIIAAFSAIVAGVAAVSCSQQQERNIALMRAATSSSAADFCHTAQLATDGIIDTAAPVRCIVLMDGKPVDRVNSEYILDFMTKTCIISESGNVCLELQMDGWPAEADCIEVQGRCIPAGKDVQTDGQWNAAISYCGPDGEWSRIASYSGKGFPEPAKGHKKSFALTGAVKGTVAMSRVRFEGSCPDAKSWRIDEIVFYSHGKRVEKRPSMVFHSYWISGGAKDEWLTVDLGAKSRLGQMRLLWRNAPAAGSVLVSKDGRNWKKAASLGNAAAGNPLAEETISLSGSARWIKLQLDSTADGKPFILSELQLQGSNSITPRETSWQLCRSDRIADPRAWVSATVPGTVLSSYIDNGAVPDPYYGDNNLHISESYFLHDFVYRGTMDFSKPAGSQAADRVWLNFDGINWKADVSLNGQALGSIEGAFTTARFDVTDIIREGSNDVEVLIHTPANPGTSKCNTIWKDAPNGGRLGADNPTFHASIGWDWIPGIRDRNIGIWNDIYFSTSGSVTVEDTFVDTVLDEQGAAHVNITATLENHGGSPVEGIWKASVGDSTLICRATVPAGGSTSVGGVMIMKEPRLWWPNGYGEQNLYEVRSAFYPGMPATGAQAAGAQTGTAAGAQTAGEPGTASPVASDEDIFTTGLREMTYSTEDGRLTVWVNGRRLAGRGGNWGFSEATLRYRAREYDIAVGLHKAQNFTMIRNWVCQTGDNEFYDACDRHGIMVWQDFWLANPGDGPEPDDEAMFMQNADNFMRRIRNHPSIAFWCGRNEGMPPASLNKALQEKVSELCPNSFYIPDSSHGVVGGNGKYNRWSAEEYFGNWNMAPEKWGQNRIHSERGMPNVPNYESLVKFIPEEHLWPQDLMWAIHDWTLQSAQKVGTFNDAVESMFGMPGSAERFCQLAQWVNYDGFRAIFESRSQQRRGILLWMSHSAWPSMVWCTYDYWFDPTAAFFGCKKGCEPLHIQWNPVTRMVEVVNYSAGDQCGLTAKAQVLDMWGNLVSEHSAIIDSREDSTVELFELTVPGTGAANGAAGTEAAAATGTGAEPDCPPVYYFRLIISRDDTLLAENFYVEGSETDNFKALLSLPKARLSSKWDGSTLTLSNVSPTPAMMVRITARDRRSGERVLPVLYSDNYFHLMPGQSRSISISSWPGEAEVRIAPEVTGFNL